MKRRLLPTCCVSGNWRDWIDREDVRLPAWLHLVYFQTGVVCLCVWFLAIKIISIKKEEEEEEEEGRDEEGKGEDMR